MSKNIHVLNAIYLKFLISHLHILIINFLPLYSKCFKHLTHFYLKRPVVIYLNAQNFVAAKFQKDTIKTAKSLATISSHCNDVTRIYKIVV